MSALGAAVENSQKPLRQKRIGLVVPSVNTGCEMDFHRLVPEGVSVHTARMMVLGDVTGLVDWEKPTDWDADYQMMHDKYEEAAKEIACARVDVIVFGCTSGSFIKGPGADKQVCQKIEEAVLPICGKIPALTASTAAVAALEELRIKNVSLVTPYPRRISEKGKTFLEGNGFRVVEMRGLELERFSQIGRQSPKIIYDLAKEADKKDADGIFISCTELGALDVIEALEREIGKPVVTCNQASVWLALRKLNIDTAIKGYGMLLDGSYE